MNVTFGKSDPRMMDFPGTSESKKVVRSKHGDPSLVQSGSMGSTRLRVYVRFEVTSHFMTQASSA
jgi:hypothetical protein